MFRSEGANEGTEAEQDCRGPRQQVQSRPTPTTAESRQQVQRRPTPTTAKSHVGSQHAGFHPSAQATGDEREQHQVKLPFMGALDRSKFCARGVVWSRLGCV